MRIRRGNRTEKREAARSPQKAVRMGRTLPTDTYYSPQSRRGQTSKNSGKVAAKQSAASSMYSALRIAVRWGGVLILIAVVVFNGGLLSTGVKVRFGDNNSVSSPFRSEEEYTRVVADVFSRSKFNNSKLTFNSTQFEQDIREILPEVNKATAVVPLLGRGCK